MVYTGGKLRTVVPTRVSLMIHVFPVLHPPPRTKTFAGTITSARGGFQHYTINFVIWTPGSPPISGSQFNINIPTSTTIFHRQRRDRELTPVLISNILDKVNARMNATAFQCTLVVSSTLSKNPGQEYAAPIANAGCHS